MPGAGLEAGDTNTVPDTEDPKQTRGGTARHGLSEPRGLPAAQFWAGAGRTPRPTILTRPRGQALSDSKVSRNWCFFFLLSHNPFQVYSEIV